MVRLWDLEREGMPDLRREREGRAMTVAELIRALEACDLAAEVILTPVIWRVPVNTVEQREDGDVELSA